MTTSCDALLLAFGELADALGTGSSRTAVRSRRIGFVASCLADRTGTDGATRATAVRAALIHRLAADDLDYTSFGRDTPANASLPSESVALALASCPGCADIASAIASHEACWTDAVEATRAAELLAAAVLVDTALVLATDARGTFDPGIAVDLLASTADCELSRELANAATKIVDDPTLRHRLADPVVAIAEIVEALPPLDAPQIELLERLARCTEARQPYYRNHARRTAAAAATIARRLHVDSEVLARIELCALAHDVGEMGLPADALVSSSRHASPPTTVRSHPTYSAELCARVPVLAPIAGAVNAHHEHWDGSGYPLGLVGAAIPIEARIVAVADAFDALRGERAFRNAYDGDEVRLHLAAGRGKAYDPQVVEAALAALDFDE